MAENGFHITVQLKQQFNVFLGVFAGDLRLSVKSDLRLGSSEVLRSLRHYLRAQSQGKSYDRSSRGETEAWKEEEVDDRP